MTQPLQPDCHTPPGDLDADGLRPLDELFAGADDETGLTMEELLKLERQFLHHDREGHRPRTPRAS